MLRRIYCTDHALVRWRQRASGDPDATREDVRRAVRESRLVTQDEFLHLGRVPGSVYYFHEVTGCYFVAVPLQADEVRIVTVIAREAAPPVVPVPGSPGHRWANCAEERAWLVEEYQRVSLLIEEIERRHRKDVRRRAHTGQLHDQLREMASRLRVLAGIVT